MSVLNRVNSPGTNFNWFNQSFPAKSNCYRVEIYIKPSSEAKSDLLKIFDQIFASSKNDFLINNRGGSWWDYCLDTWNIKTGENDYSFHNKSPQTIAYLQMLNDSQIDPSYEGFCSCNDWDTFLNITLECVATHVAPYGLHFYNIRDSYILYFHHSSSSGIYFKEPNTEVQLIAGNAQRLDMEVAFVKLPLR